MSTILKCTRVVHLAIDRLSTTRPREDGARWGGYSVKCPATRRDMK